MVTGGKFAKVFDASAMATDVGLGALLSVSNLDDKIKYFATTND